MSHPELVIGIGGAAGTLALSGTDIAALANGFAQITVGRADGNGTMNVGTASFKDALVLLERQRLRKSPQELAMLRTASEKVIDAMTCVIASHGPGSTKEEIAEALRREEVNRGMTFEYCLIAAGASHNRAPSPQRWEEGDVLSVDSGANYHGYIGDLARMAILGEPDAELEDRIVQWPLRLPKKARQPPA